MATYAYDGLNRRVVKGIYVSGTLDHNEHAYFNEKWQILEVRKEVSGMISSNPLEQYVWHPFYIDAPVLRDYDSSTSGSPTRYYYAFDANYNVTAATTPLESLLSGITTRPTELSRSLTKASTRLAQHSSIGNSLTYTGCFYDAESGLYQYRSRYFESQLGCFLVRDLIGYYDGLNLYAYVLHLPTSRVDPFGYKATKVCCGCSQSCSLGSICLGGPHWTNSFTETDRCEPNPTESMTAFGAML